MEVGAEFENQINHNSELEENYFFMLPFHGEDNFQDNFENFDLSNQMTELTTSIKQFGEYFLCQICPYVTNQKINIKCHLGNDKCDGRSINDESWNGDKVRANRKPSRAASREQLNPYQKWHFECDSCDEKFLSKLVAMRHMKEEHVKEDHFCSACRKKFHKLEHLENHYEVHLGLKTFRCPKCTFTTSTYEKVSNHVKRQHSWWFPDFKKAYL